MNLKYYLLLCFLFVNTCYADRLIQATKYDDQEEVLVQGAPVVISNKINSVLMYQTCEVLKEQRGSFYFSLSNNTKMPINFYFSNLRVTDQSGKPIKIIHKKEIIAKKENTRNWQLLSSALSASSDTKNANHAGTIHYQSHTNRQYNSNFNIYGSDNNVKGNISDNNSSTTNETIHVEALRQQALRKVRKDTTRRNDAIQANYEDWVYRLNNFYFDSTTLFPGKTYSANFHIYVDKATEKKLQYLIFTYQIDGEEHKFCFYCGKIKKKWYHFFS